MAASSVDDLVGLDAAQAAQAGHTRVPESTGRGDTGCGCDGCWLTVKRTRHLAKLATLALDYKRLRKTSRIVGVQAGIAWVWGLPGWGLSQ
ncbi:MAG: hypothetical protein K0U76_12715 [Actinomycetia bacterium]|nr:hypothetical protein [Actinomycetes bacterium]MCH9759401.1 hypothetical protein [Actinomycetes bacterium]